ncbi:MAG: zf-HC2 domain-containing protein [Bryobacterales bacterium]|nr:zf-HC2 domain-containing protein [Bryobacterales bacterium]
MDHREALESRAAERYLLNELGASDRLRFEEHYFSCSECAGEVKTSFQMAANLRAVLPEFDRLPVPPPPAAVVWPSRLALAGMLAFGLTVGSFLPWAARPSVAVPQGTVVSAAIPAAARGASAAGGRAIRPGPNAGVLLLRLDVQDDIRQASTLSWQVRNAAGETLRFETPREGQVSLPLPAAQFPAGRYEIVMRAEADGITERYPFTVQPN